MTKKSKSLQLAEKYLLFEDGEENYIVETNIRYEHKILKHYVSFSDRVCYTDNLWRDMLIREAIKMFPEIETTPSIAKNAFEIIKAHAHFMECSLVFELLHEDGIDQEFSKTGSFSQEYEMWLASEERRKEMENQ